MYPVDELKVAGVDITKPEVIESAINMFNDTIEEFKSPYANSYNSKLAYALRYDSTPSVALLPFSKDGQTGLTLSAKFSY